MSTPPVKPTPVIKPVESHPVESDKTEAPVKTEVPVTFTKPEVTMEVDEKLIGNDKTEAQRLKDAFAAASRNVPPVPVPVSQFKPVKQSPEIESVTKKITDIQKEFGGESNIPVNSEYWQLTNRLRMLRNS